MIPAPNAAMRDMPPNFVRLLEIVFIADPNSHMNSLSHSMFDEAGAL